MKKFGIRIVIRILKIITNEITQGKRKNKIKLQAYFNLPQNPNVLLFVMVTRLTEQKVDLLISSAERIVQ